MIPGSHNSTREIQREREREEEVRCDRHTKDREEVNRYEATSEVQAQRKEIPGPFFYYFFIFIIIIIYLVFCCCCYLLVVGSCYSFIFLFFSLFFLWFFFLFTFDFLKYLMDE